MSESGRPKTIYDYRAGYELGYLAGLEQGRREERERLKEVVKGLQKRYSNTTYAEVWEVGVQDGLGYVLAALEKD